MGRKNVWATYSGVFGKGRSFAEQANKFLFMALALASAFEGPTDSTGCYASWWALQYMLTKFR